MSSQTNTRLLAVKIITQVVFDAVALNVALASTTTSYPLIEADQAFIKKLCTGTMTHFFSLSAIANILLNGRAIKNKDRDIFSTLLIGLYQMVYLDTPAHAAVFETVKICKALRKTSAKLLINACLRRFLREKETVMAQALTDPCAQLEHPPWLINAIQTHWSAYADAVFAANNQKPSLCLRINTQHMDIKTYQQQLNEHKINHTPCAYSKTGLLLETTERIQITQLPGYQTGCFYIQDESAQLAGPLLSIQPGHRVLDVCAAPGGKLTHLLELEPGVREIIAIDNDPRRIETIKENLRRLNHPKQLAEKIKLKTADANKIDDWWDGELFDRILIDAPCSSTGVIRRHPDIKLIKKPGDIHQLSVFQKNLIQAIWSVLKPGGVLVYATCSILPEENEQVIAYAVKHLENCQHQPIMADWGVVPSSGLGRQVLPGGNQNNQSKEGCGKGADKDKNKKGERDGFYYGVLRKG